jgi:hypothetical protein
MLDYLDHYFSLHGDEENKPGNTNESSLSPSTSNASKTMQQQQHKQQKRNYNKMEEFDDEEDDDDEFEKKKFSDMKKNRFRFTNKYNDLSISFGVGGARLQVFI